MWCQKDPRLRVSSPGESLLNFALVGTLHGKERVSNKYFLYLIMTHRTIHELLGRLNTRGIKFSPEVVKAPQLGSLINCVDHGVISAKVGKTILNLMIEGDLRDAEAIVEEKGWRQMENHDELDKLCEDMISQYQDKVKSVQKGNVGVLGFFVGQIMKQSKGRANPVVVNQILRTKMGLPEVSESESAGQSSRSDQGQKNNKKK